jgi:hypothetical protein
MFFLRHAGSALLNCRVNNVVLVGLWKNPIVLCPINKVKKDVGAAFSRE